jgi:hypothetical protein
MYLLDFLLNDLRFYRRWRGGTWYHVRDVLSGGGMEGEVKIWHRNMKRPEGWEIITIEKY